MFITARKEKGVEKGCFVVLDEETKMKSLDKPFDSHFYVNRKSEIMYIVNDDVFRDGNFALCVPVIFDTNDHWQHGTKRNKHRKKIMYLYKKSILKVLNGDALYVKFDELGFDGYGTLRTCVSSINDSYESVFKENNLGYINLEKWGDKLR